MNTPGSPKIAVLRCYRITACYSTETVNLVVSEDWGPSVSPNAVIPHTLPSKFKFPNMVATELMSLYTIIMWANCKK